MKQSETRDAIARLRSDPTPMACLACMGLSIVLMSLTVWLA